MCSLEADGEVALGDDAPAPLPPVEVAPPCVHCRDQLLHLLLLLLLGLPSVVRRVLWRLSDVDRWDELLRPSLLQLQGMLVLLLLMIRPRLRCLEARLLLVLRRPRLRHQARHAQLHCTDGHANQCMMLWARLVVLHGGVRFNEGESYDAYLTHIADDLYSALHL